MATEIEKAMCDIGWHCAECVGDGHADGDDLCGCGWCVSAEGEARLEDASDALEKAGYVLRAAQRDAENARYRLAKDCRYYLAVRREYREGAWGYSHSEYSAWHRDFVDARDDYHRAQGKLEAAQRDYDDARVIWERVMATI